MTIGVIKGYVLLMPLTSFARFVTNSTGTMNTMDRLLRHKTRFETRGARSATNAAIARLHSRHFFSKKSTQEARAQSRNLMLMYTVAMSILHGEKRGEDGAGEGVSIGGKEAAGYKGFRA